MVTLYTDSSVSVTQPENTFFSFSDVNNRTVNNVVTEAFAVYDENLLCSIPLFKYEGNSYLEKGERSDSAFHSLFHDFGSIPHVAFGQWLSKTDHHQFIYDIT